MLPELSAQMDVRLASNEKTSIRLLFLMSSLTIGGSERKSIRIANELHQRGCNVHLAYLNPPTTLRDSLNRDIPVLCLDRRGKFSFAAVKALERYITQEQISRIVCINLYPLIYALAARRQLSPEARPSVILTINTTHHHGIKEKASMTLYSRLIRRAERVIFGCRVQLELWCARYALDKEKCVVVYNGVDHDTFSPSNAFPRIVDGITVRDDAFLIGNVGQFRPVKNQIELIMALARLKDTLPNARVVLVGDGPEQSRLETAAREAGVSERVWFLGPRDDVRPILQMLDLFVVPSISETFSNAALEAMSMGKAVILSDTGGAREMVQHGITGFLYQQGNIDALAAQIEGLAVDSDRRHEIGKDARQAVLEKFSLMRMANEYQDLVSRGFVAQP